MTGPLSSPTHAALQRVAQVQQDLQFAESPQAVLQVLHQALAASSGLQGLVLVFQHLGQQVQFQLGEVNPQLLQDPTEPEGPMGAEVVRFSGSCLEHSTLTLLLASADQDPLLDTFLMVVWQLAERRIQELLPTNEPTQATPEFLRALLMSTQEAIVACSADGTLQFFNEATRKLHGLPLVAVPADQVAEHYALYNAQGSALLAPHEVPLYRALRGEKVEGMEIIVRPHKQLPRHVVCFGNQILSRTGEVLGAVIVMHDVTESKVQETRLQLREQMLQVEHQARMHSRRALEQSQVVQAVAQQLLLRMSPADMAQVVHTEVQPLLPVRAIYLMLEDPGLPDVALSALAVSGTTEPDDLLQVPRDVHTPATEVMRTGHPLFLASRSAFLQRFPHLAHARGRLQSPSMGVLPLRTGEQVLGVLFFAFAEERTLLPDEMAFLENLTHLVTLALERNRQHEVEQQLRRSQEETIARLEAILHNAPFGVGFLDKHLRYQSVNPKLAEYNQHPVVEHIGQTPVQLFGDPAIPLEEALHMVLSTGLPLLDFEFTESWSRGQLRHWLANYFPVVTQEGRTIGIGGTVQDITSRKQAEQALQESQLFLQRIADTSPTLLYLYDLQNHRVTYANRHLTDVLGYTPEEALAMPSEEVLALSHPEEAGEGLQHLQRLMGLQDGETIEREFQLRHRNGSWRHLYSQQAIFARDGQGQPRLVLTGALDITTRKRTEQQLVHSEQQLRQLTESQKRFVADAAHELRNPLTSIQGNLDLMVRHPNLDEQDKKEIIQDVQKEATRLGRLVHDMLQLARGDAGAQLRMDRVALHDLLLDAWNDLSRSNPQHTFVLEDLSPVLMTGDSDRLKQLCIILIENAAKYTPAGGTLRASLNLQDDEARLQVSDTGLGIIEQDLPRVFERFYRADQSRQSTGDPGGTGLGLPIAQWIVEHHGGKIWLESELGKGTTAIVLLPLVAPED